MPDLAEILPVLQRWAETVTAADEALALLASAVGSEPEAPVPQAMYALQGLADEWAAERIGTSTHWLEWYRLENDMGERGHEAGWEDDMRPIRSLEDFAALLAGDIQRADAEAAR